MHNLSWCWIHTVFKVVMFSWVRARVNYSCRELTLVCIRAIQNGFVIWVVEVENKWVPVVIKEYWEVSNLQLWIHHDHQLGLVKIEAGTKLYFRQKKMYLTIRWAPWYSSENMMQPIFFSCSNFFYVQHTWSNSYYNIIIYYIATACPWFHLGIWIASKV